MQRINHYEWCGAMYCNKSSRILGNFEYWEGKQCPYCKESIKVKQDQSRTMYL